MTGSIFIGFIFKFLGTLNRYYENSAAYRLANYLTGWFNGSFVSQGFYKLFCVESKSKYTEGSALFRLLYWLTDRVTDISSKTYAVLKINVGKLGSGGLFHSLATDLLPRFGNSLGNVLDGSILKSLALFFIAGRDIKTQKLYKLLTLEIPFMAFLFVTCVIPHHLWSNTYIFLAAVLLLGLYILRVVSGKTDSPRQSKGVIKSLPPAFVIFACLSFLSLFISYDFSDSLRIFLIFVSCLVICALLQGAITTKKLFESFISVIFFAMVVSSLYGIYQYHSGIEVRADLVDLVASQGLMRLFSTMDNPNNFAEFLVLMLPLSVAHVLTRKTDIEKLFYAVLLMPCVLALVLTYSRAALLVILIAAGVFVLLTCPRLAPLCIIIFIACIPFLPSSITNRILTIGKDTSSTYRLWIWQGALRVLNENWLIGVGMGPGAFARVYRPVAYPLAMTAMHSHNLLLQIWIETGLFSFVSFVVLMFTTFKNCVTRSISPLCGEYRFYTAAAAATIPAIFVFSLVEYIWFYPRIMLLFWVMIGLALKAANLSDSSSGATETE